MAMSEAQLLAQLKERMKEPVLEFTQEIALMRQLAKERFKALPPRSPLSKAVEGRGLHGPMSSKAARSEISILDSDMFLPSEAKKPPDGGD